MLWNSGFIILLLKWMENMIGMEFCICLVSIGLSIYSINLVGGNDLRELIDRELFFVSRCICEN